MLAVRSPDETCRERGPWVISERQYCMDRYDLLVIGGGAAGINRLKVATKAGAHGTAVWHLSSARSRSGRARRRTRWRPRSPNTRATANGPLRAVGACRGSWPYR